MCLLKFVDSFISQVRHDQLLGDAEKLALIDIAEDKVQSFFGMLTTCLQLSHLALLVLLGDRVLLLFGQIDAHAAPHFPTCTPHLLNTLLNEMHCATGHALDLGRTPRPILHSVMPTSGVGHLHFLARLFRIYLLVKPKLLGLSLALLRRCIAPGPLLFEAD